MDNFKKQSANKESGNYATPPTPKDKKLNKRQRARLKRKLPKPPILDEDYE